MTQLDNNPAWNLLAEDEKTSLALIHSYGKSTWEAGSIMKKTHYKFLEVKVRAQLLFQMFDKQISKYGELFPPGGKILPLSIITYFNVTIGQRKKPAEAVKLMMVDYRDTEYREKAIIQVLKGLEISTSKIDRDVFNLIMEFDRVNSFRILPKSIQEKSIYKRRNKTRYRRFLKVYSQLPEFTLLMLIDKYELGKASKSPRFYLPLISPFLENGYTVIAVRDSKEGSKVSDSYAQLEKSGLFLFYDSKDAHDFAKLVGEYFHSPIKTAKTGQKFWPSFRDLMVKSSNYDEIDNIMLGRENLPEIILSSKKSRIDKLK